MNLSDNVNNNNMRAAHHRAALLRTQSTSDKLRTITTINTINVARTSKQRQPTTEASKLPSYVV